MIENYTGGSIEQFMFKHLRGLLLGRLNFQDEGIAELRRWLIIKHESEWYGKSDEPCWKKILDECGDKERPWLTQWRDDVEWMSQVEGFKEKAQRQLWHFHPLEFVCSISQIFTDVIEFQTTLGIYRVSKKSAEFILSWESYVPAPYVPDGDNSSGVTVGYGYDLGQQNASSAREILSDYYSEAQVARLLSAIGKKGNQARAIVNNLSDITIDKEKALSMAMVLKRNYSQVVVDTYPQAINLPPDSAGAILSLVYNRGPSLELAKPNDPLDRRREMREISDDFAAGNVSNIPSRLRSMKRLWTSQRGLVFRREGEAKLIEGDL